MNATRVGIASTVGAVLVAIAALFAFGATLGFAGNGPPVDVPPVEAPPVTYRLAPQPTCRLSTRLLVMYRRDHLMTGLR